MAKRRKRKEEELDELEAAIDETSEDRGAKKDRSKGSTHAHKGRRRAERMAQVEQERRRKRVRNVVLAVVVAAIVVAASIGIYYFTRPEPNPIVVIETTKGNIEVELYMDECPITAGNFKKLTEEGFYDGLTFHRIMETFMIQGGDPNGDGSGGPGYSIAEEKSALALTHHYGAISMANSGSPDTAGSQFFIVTAQGGRTDLDGSYAVFGKVTSGMDVVMEIAKVSVTDNGQGEQSRPLTRIYMNKVSIKD